MHPEIKLVISANNEVIQTVTQTINEKLFSDAIKDFQDTANAALTKIIEANGDAAGDCEMAEEEGSESEEEDIGQNPKKKRK